MSRENYAFPEVYLEDEESDIAIIYVNDEYILTRDKEKIMKAEKKYGHILYEDVIDKAIDLVEPRITKEIIVIPEYTGSDEMKAYIIPKNTKPCLIEVKGIQPYVFIEELSEIDEKDKIAYTITGKGEVRVTRSPCKGVVVLVVNLPWEKPERYIIVVVRRDELRQITVRKDKGNRV